MTHGFPVPTTDRDEIVNESLEWLKEKNVWSRGRFGAFKYEVGGADHCFIQGVEAVDNIVHGQAETTAFDSTAANELGVVQSKPYFAVDQLMAEINGETADPEPDAVESEATEPAVEAAEVAEAAELVEDAEAETESTVVVDATELPPADEVTAEAPVETEQEAAPAVAEADTPAAEESTTTEEAAPAES